ncbi:MAG: hypothetical protein E7354_02290 [Clostridiales bacterium]|nr:hypothetical protein [Clostridiales bacterium]
MGLISKLKDLFNKNIECSIDADANIIFPLKKKKYLFVKKNIVVKDDFACVLVYKSRVAEVLNPGKYKINSENLPTLFDMADMHKKKKKGVKKIRADVYYICKKEFKDFYFISDSPFVSKSNEMGKVKGCLQGICTIKAIDSEQLMRCVLSKLSRPNIKKINHLLSLIVGNVVNKKIKKLKITANELLTNAKSLEAVINTELEDAYDRQGIFVKDVKLKAVNFSKRYKKKVGEYMAHHRRMVRNSVNPENRVRPFQYVSQNRAMSQNSAPVVTNNHVVDTATAHDEFKPFKICDRCGVENSIDSKICNNCGKNF